LAQPANPILNKEIEEYYSHLANQYDQDRFDNSYGQFIDIQEKNMVRNILTENKEKVLDLGCGTGRFLEFAQYGMDISPEMIEIAKIKYPSRYLFTGNAMNTNFEDSFFDAIISFHLFMHFNREVTEKVLDEAHRILKKGGKIIFDIPSLKRRKIINYKSKNWHGANAISIKQVKELTSDKWNLINYYGILFMPLHRIPVAFRKNLTSIDTKLCNSILKEYSSYLVIVMEKI
jgi:ubiquinone/menaquinone biosynthesis C-methylase UbiE